MPEPPSNAKIYDRPEKKGPSPLVIGVILLVLLLAGYFLYRTVFHREARPQQSRSGTIRVHTAFWQENAPHQEQVQTVGSL